MPTWKAKVKPGGKNPAIDVTIEAKNQADAKRLFEARYGKGNVTSLFRAYSGSSATCVEVAV